MQIKWKRNGKKANIKAIVNNEQQYRQNTPKGQWRPLSQQSNNWTYFIFPDLSPGFLYRTMPRFAPANPEPFTAICEDLKRKILPGMTHWQHPRFYAYFPAGRRYPDVLAEIVTSAMAFNVFSWESCPSLNELEHAIVNWVGRAFGLPEAFLFQRGLR
ncbi:hypothetical protein NECAME_16408 [Necator americanus]|uniref:Pyridoxal-dependent decarboxylase domain protein n=1 Tax=Necator americanus TaxID=51031 RepID=W2TZ39_NECAM|nr:hypothetical protein NECAME_16408 [Necator americanus]ETN86326.1 hypothetical protein NECAME_16408 [Necator americanus]